MELLPEDIERLISLGFRLRDFACYKAGYVRLKNVNGHCVFFDERAKSCRIYPYRPIGCRLYPLIFDDVLGVTIDEECPMAYTIDEKEVERLAPYVILFVKRASQTLDWITVRFGVEGRREVLEND